jgi:aldehyde:ferredoxin oxidoreductase
VMGSKNLRAVAVRGNQNIPVTTRKRVTGVSKWLGDNYKTKAASFVAIGTPGNVNSLAAASALPTNNFQDPFFAEHKSISGQLMQETILIGRDTCQACPISCKQVVEYENETFADSPYMRSDFLQKLKISKEYGGPEYESIAALGSACGVDDFIAIAKANEQTARYGLDSISLGMTIAFVMECVGRGLLTAEQTGGFLPRFGSAADMMQAVEMIAHGEGFGVQMGQGSKRLAAWIGGDAADYLVEVKGQELPMHEPRAKHALGVGYAVAPVGADHMMNMHDTGFAQPGEGLERVAEIKRFPPMAFNDLSHQKMELFYHEVNRKHMLDSAVICHFLPYYPSHVAEVLGGLTGHDYTPQELLAVGERAQTLCRLFNLREGFTEEDDRMPRRVMKAFKEGPLAGVEITQEMFLNARNHWYGLMGWSEAGVPTAERLQSLELTEILDGMEFVTA